MLFVTGRFMELELWTNIVACAKKILTYADCFLVIP